ncbi:zonular occludens toxin domain protein [Acinetobacter sp. 1592897]|nr:hypothetical protein [Acinetobacter sp. 1592897]EYT12609.1 zonular occludens toxin domain protein [Acinetobacter sp. 1592897]
MGFVESDPDDFQKANFKNGCTTTIYRPNKEVFNWYESTVLDTHKFKIPTKLIKGVAMVGAIFGLCFWFGYPVVSKYYHAAKKDTPDNKTASTFTPHTEVANPNKTIADQVKEQAAFAGLTPEQYADLMNPEKRNTELQARNDVRMDTIAVKYNPFIYVDVSEIKYEVTAKPVFSGCMKKHGKYVAYTQQGTVLHDVSQSDCRKLIEDGIDHLITFNSK